jgi:hypothetical protein
MSVLAGTSVLREFLGFMSSSAQSSADKFAPDTLPDDLKHELDAFLALALAAYDELRALSEEATRAPASAEVAGALREAHGAFVQGCRPLLRLLGHARRVGVTPRRADAFMAAFGEADLIANRSQRLVESERQADHGQTRALEDVRDELRRRAHARGG